MIGAVSETAPKNSCEYGQALMAEIRAKTLQALEDGGAREKAIRVLIEEIEAFETKTYNHNGEIIYSKDLVAHGPRLKAVELLVSMMGLKEPEKMEVKHDLSTAFRQLAATLIQSDPNPTEEPKSE